jgi:hypothetical protein
MNSFFSQNTKKVIRKMTSPIPILFSSVAKDERQKNMIYLNNNLCRVRWTAGGRQIKLCIETGCEKYARYPINFCRRHGGGARCEHENCDKSAVSSTELLCRGHGGARCKYADCKTSARLPTDFCIRHNGGRRCQSDACKKSAQNSTDFCIRHGGGRRCQSYGCKSSARLPTNFCKLHGGGKRCQSDGCKKSAQNPSDFCVHHGGGTRCQSEACQIYDVAPFARLKVGSKYLCGFCLKALYPELSNTRTYIRQEHLILAEIQRLIEDKLPNVIRCIWDCPMDCTLRRPDLIYSLDDGVHIIFEVDEFGHEQSTKRIHEIRSSLNTSKLFMFRINPNLKQMPLLKKRKEKDSNEFKWVAMPYFNNGMKTFGSIVIDFLEEYYEDETVSYVEVGYLYEDEATPLERGGDIKRIENGFAVVI